VADQLVEIVGRDPEIAGDAVELGAVEPAHLVQLAAMLEPIGECADQGVEARIWFGMSGHGTPPLANGPRIGRAGVALDQKRGWAPKRSTAQA
jgi:hypothetical protein